MSLRVLFLSNSALVATGYGNQTALFVPRLIRAGHPVAVHGFYGVEGSMLNWNDVLMYPKHCDPYGQDIAGAHAQHFGADVILTLIDAWVMKPENYGGVPWVAWAPVDMEPIPVAVADKLRQAHTPIAYSRFGLSMMRDAGLDARYVPHGIDSAAFAPMPMDEARAVLGWPTDRFVVGMVAANKGWPSRKAYPEQIEAFALFKAKHPDALLWLHTHVGTEYGGVPITTICEQFGLTLGRDYGFCDQYRNVVGGYDTVYMRALYSSLDVLLNVSTGEGFGIPILEAQACGTPVVVGGWTAMPELCFAGRMVDRADAHRAWQPLLAWQMVPRPAAIAEQLEWAYANSRNADVRAMARARAVEYDADRVTAEYWVPVLAEIEQRVHAPQQVAAPIATVAA